MINELHNDIEVRRAISPVVATNNTALESEVIDRANYETVEFLIATGTLADSDATFAVTMVHGDESNDLSAVGASDLLGSLAEASFTHASDNVTRKIGYKGARRYVKLVITPSDNTGNAPISAVAVLAGARKLPV